MKLLLDTHTFIWWTIQKASLSALALAVMQDPQNQLLLSIASLWEMQLKMQLGKLHFNLPLSQLIEDQQRINGLRLLPIEPVHIYALSQLPSHHKDPFDRLLITQAITENFLLVSADPAFAAYSVRIIW
ncbi:MAG: type II toxin-antitoxin system VapC family toxin [Acidobacteria bacterium]|nr:type II toxin-antitoxin system VapC family toxin [Acidobacteriota bacterium]